MVHDFWYALVHPISQTGTNLYGGIGSDLTEITIIGAIVAAYQHRQCHVTGCHRLSWHPHPEHGHPVCKKHHPETGAGHLSRDAHES